MFFDTLLNMLKEDQHSQCRAMLRVTVMGQLAAESLDDVRQKYKRMTRVILRNMRVREQTLNSVRYQVQDLWAYALSLMRVEASNCFTIVKYRYLHNGLPRYFSITMTIVMTYRVILSSYGKTSTTCPSTKYWKNSWYIWRTSVIKLKKVYSCALITTYYQGFGF